VTDEVAKRWDSDERGTGVGDARRLLEGAMQLTEALSRPGWVAEQPESHLLPNLSAWISAISNNLEIVSTALGTDGSFEVELRWTGRPRDMRSVRGQVFSLIGQVAEGATYVRQRSPTGGDAGGVHEQPGSDVVSFEVATGMLEDDTTFASHGHVLLIKVTGVSGGR
jgi:hypothetical protein